MIVPIEPDFQNVRPEAENFIQSALDTLPAHIAILDHSGEIIGVNAAWGQLAADSAPPMAQHGMGMNYLAACEQYWQMDLPPVSLMADGLRELVAGYREMLELEYSRADRRFFVVRARRFCWHEELRLTVAHENITELVYAQRQLSRQMSARLQEETHQLELKDRCLSMMSHELRTPLASIQLSHDMLTHYGERTSANERRQYLDNIQLQVKQLNEIVSDVLSLSKSNRSELDFNPSYHDLITFCRDIVESFQFNGDHMHRLSFHCDDAEIRAEFDPKLLRRALTNLMSNATKYSPDGGDVSLCLWRDADVARISVRDEGIGIPEEDAVFLFQASHRASNVGSLPGTGLGLTIAKQALDFHQGEITFTTELGVGTTFQVALPLRLCRDH